MRDHEQSHKHFVLSANLHSLQLQKLAMKREREREEGEESLKYI